MAWGMGQIFMKALGLVQSRSGQPPQQVCKGQKELVLTLMGSMIR